MANGEDFLCGVVEGFYSRPWSVDQRLDLYEKMEKYRLNTYVCTVYLYLILKLCVIKHLWDAYLKLRKDDLMFANHFLTNSTFVKNLLIIVS